MVARGFTHVEVRKWLFCVTSSLAAWSERRLQVRRCGLLYFDLEWHPASCSTVLSKVFSRHLQAYQCIRTPVHVHIAAWSHSASPFPATGLFSLTKRFRWWHWQMEVHRPAVGSMLNLCGEGNTISDSMLPSVSSTVIYMVRVGLGLG